MLLASIHFKVNFWVLFFKWHANRAHAHTSEKVNHLLVKKVGVLSVHTNIKKKVNGVHL